MKMVRTKPALEVKEESDSDSDIIETASLGSDDESLPSSSHSLQEVKEEEVEPDFVKPKKRKLATNGTTKVSAKRQRELGERERVGRVKPDVAADRERDRFLLKVATKGVVQLFNAVGRQQAALAKSEADAGPWERKKDKAKAKVARDKTAFLSKLDTGPGWLEAGKKAKKEEAKAEPSEWDDSN